MAIALPIKRSDIGVRSAQYSPAIVAGLVVSADVLAIILSGNIAFLLGVWTLPVRYVSYLSVSVLAAGVVVGTFGYLKLYKFDALVNPTDQLRKIVVACCL